MADHSPVLVDLSNVAKDSSLGYDDRHVNLARWDRLRAQWVRERGEPSGGWLLVADASITRTLDRAQLLKLQGMQARGEAMLVPDADVEILRRAAAAGGTVLSNDRFVDHLKMPGLDGVSLFGWRVLGGRVAVVPRPLDRLQSVLISQRAGKQLRKERGLPDDAPQLAYRWYCRDAACAEELIALPKMERGEAVCPSCGSYLERGAHWEQPIWLKIMHRSDEVCRFVLEDGESAMVGRAVDDETVSLAGEFELANDVMKIDPHHVELLNKNGRLWVTDLGSAAGTALRHPAAGRRNVHLPPAPLPPQRATPVGSGMKIVLGRSPFVIQISGGPTV